MKRIIFSFILLVPTISLGMKRNKFTTGTNSPKQTLEEKKNAKKSNNLGLTVQGLWVIGSPLARHFFNNAIENNSPTGSFHMAHLETNPKKKIALYEQALQTDPTGDHLTRNLAAQEVVKVCNQLVVKYAAKKQSDKAELYRQKAKDFTEKQHIIDLDLWESSLDKNDPTEVYRVAYQGNKLCNQLIAENEIKGDTVKVEFFRAKGHVFATKLNELNKK